jgi:hypothetical protein
LKIKDEKKQDPDPDPLVRGTDPRIWISTKYTVLQQTLVMGGVSRWGSRSADRLAAITPATSAIVSTSPDLENSQV